MSYPVEVTNISVDTTQSKLHDFFSFCGKIDKIEHKAEAKSATIYFEKVSAAKTALMLNGGSLDGSNLTVTSSAVTGDERHEETAEERTRAESPRQEDKPRAGIVAEYLAKGYELGEPILQRAIDMDKKNGISSRFLAYIKRIDQTIGGKIVGPETTLSQKAINTGKAFDEKHGVLTKANTYFEKALATPTGQKIRDFYSSTSKQVVDIHEEARRISEFHKAEKSTTTTGAPSTSGAPSYSTSGAPSTSAATDATASDVKATGL